MVYSVHILCVVKEHGRGQAYGLPRGSDLFPVGCTVIELFFYLRWTGLKVVNIH